MLHRLLVANRGEIAVRVLGAATELGIETVAVAPGDDRESLHTRRADTFVELEGRGVSAYLDIDQLIRIAFETGCDSVHPGYGFLSENPAFALAAEAAGLIFVGPTPEQLALFGDKSRARQAAIDAGVGVIAASGPLADDAEAEAFVREHGPTMLKAVSGGGGRGMRRVDNVDEVAAMLERCRSEAGSAFGDTAIYAEKLVADARHLEVQIIGDGLGAVTHLWERECSLQRQNQKIIEIAPSPGLDVTLRGQLLDWAVALGSSVGYRGLGTVEFLVDRSSGTASFIEANARLQVEHTITEEITGVDLVQAQLRLAGGTSLIDLGLDTSPPVSGQAIQCRINLEAMAADGSAVPTGGTLTRFDIPSGRGVRTDTYGTTGYTTSPAYDSLLAKVIVHDRGGSFAQAVRKADRALADFAIEGVETNLGFIRVVLARPEVMANDVSTMFIAEHSSGLVEAAASVTSADSGEVTDGRVGISVDRNDPLAVLAHGRTSSTSAGDAGRPSGPTGTDGVPAPMQGTILSIDVAEGDEVPAGAQLLIMEAMKMEHVISAPTAGVVRTISVAPGDAIFAGHPLVFIEPGDVAGSETAAVGAVDLDHIRSDLAEVYERHGFGLDENRDEAVARRHGTGKRTARENIADLTDGDSFVEWGSLVVAAQRKRRSLDDLVRKTPGDGLVGGIGSVNGELFGDDDTQCLVVTYDYMVLAGTQGAQNHRKKDRLFELAHQYRLPSILFAEGGGGRPGDTDGLNVAGLDSLAFGLWAEMSGLVPLIGINAGYCFAGNAALLGCCDVIIATEGSNLGMGGPAMIEGGGLGVYHPSEVGPLDEQRANGVVDLVVADEAEAVAVAKQYLSYFQGRVDQWEEADQRKLRHVIPENRLRIYDVREVIDLIFDTGSVLELRPDFGLGMITCLARVEGRPVGVVANNPVHLAGAIDSDGADKAARFMQLCDAFDLPVVNLCDTPGIMVGPEAERTALVRHASRMFVTAASLTVPTCTIVLRKGYGLGAQAMAAGGFKNNYFTVSWPTGEFGGMGLEGAVKLGYRNELEAIEDPAERLEAYEAMVAKMYEVGKGVSMADHFEIDDVIDPVDSRRMIMSMLKSAPEPAKREGKKRRFIDTW